jgi:tripartite-type tricarboxylate transporter receptor subunit TctC
MSDNWFRLVCAALLLATSFKVFAQDAGKSYPNKPVRVVVPVAPGGSTDFIGRITTAKLSEAMRQTFIIDNRAGAGGMIGTDMVAKAQPDGYTLLFTYAAHSIAPVLYSNVTYDVKKDFAPITIIGVQPLVVTVHPSFKASSIQELITLAKKTPVNFALATPTSSGALATELFKIVTNSMQMTTVPFKGGGPAVIALMSGEVHGIFATPPDVIPQIKGGKLRAIGVTSKARMLQLPDVPTLIEQGVKDLDASPWYGMIAPAKTPQPILDKLYQQLMLICKMPDVRDRLNVSGTDVVGNTPKEFTQQIDHELEQYAKVIKTIGMKGG